MHNNYHSYLYYYRINHFGVQLSTEQEVRKLLYMKKQVSQGIARKHPLVIEVRRQDAGRIFLWFALPTSGFSFESVLIPKLPTAPSQVANQTLKHIWQASLLGWASGSYSYIKLSKAPKLTRRDQ